MVQIGAIDRAARFVQRSAGNAIHTGFFDFSAAIPQPVRLTLA